MEAIRSLPSHEEPPPWWSWTQTENCIVQTECGKGDGVMRGGRWVCTGHLTQPRRSGRSSWSNGESWLSLEGWVEWAKWEVEEQGIGAGMVLSTEQHRKEQKSERAGWAIHLHTLLRRLNFILNAPEWHDLKCVLYEVQPGHSWRCGRGRRENSRKRQGPTVSRFKQCNADDFHLYCY